MFARGIFRERVEILRSDRSNGAVARGNDYLPGGKIFPPPGGRDRGRGTALPPWQRNGNLICRSRFARTPWACELHRVRP